MILRQYYVGAKHRASPPFLLDIFGSMFQSQEFQSTILCYKKVNIFIVYIFNFWIMLHKSIKSWLLKGSKASYVRHRLVRIQAWYALEQLAPYYRSSIVFCLFVCLFFMWQTLYNKIISNKAVPTKMHATVKIRIIYLLNKNPNVRREIYSTWRKEI